MGRNGRMYLKNSVLQQRLLVGFRGIIIICKTAGSCHMYVKRLLNRLRVDWTGFLNSRRNLIWPTICSYTYVVVGAFWRPGVIPYFCWGILSVELWASMEVGKRSLSEYIFFPPRSVKLTFKLTSQNFDTCISDVPIILTVDDESFLLLWCVGMLKFCFLDSNPFTSKPTSGHDYILRLKHNTNLYTPPTLLELCNNGL